MNAAQIAGVRARGIIANPNCSTIQLVVVLKPIYDRVGIERVNVATYQSVSGAGRRALETLKAQTAALLERRRRSRAMARDPLAANVVPHIDVFEDNGYTREEMKIVRETRKIMGDPTLRVNATAARVPVWFGHSEAVHIETRERISAREARAAARRGAGGTCRGRHAAPVPDRADRRGRHGSRLRGAHPRGPLARPRAQPVGRRPTTSARAARSTAFKSPRFGPKTILSYIRDLGEGPVKLFRSKIHSASRPDRPATSLHYFVGAVMARSPANLITAAALLGLPTAGFALGLGDIQLKSALNQPLDAQIEILGATPTGPARPAR